MKIIRGLIKGKTPKDAGIDVTTDWNDFVPDDYVTPDGNDHEHHEKQKHLVPRELALKHAKEMSDER